eukprot:Sspe_Gene.109434::Locus_89573_Transcript_1_1_Confidence_1.000_Length_1345::g.109434::m.109434
MVQQWGVEDRLSRFTHPQSRGEGVEARREGPRTTDVGGGARLPTTAWWDDGKGGLLSQGDEVVDSHSRDGGREEEGDGGRCQEDGGEGEVGVALEDPREANKLGIDVEVRGEEVEGLGKVDLDTDHTAVIREKPPLRREVKDYRLDRGVRGREQPGQHPRWRGGHEHMAGCEEAGGSSGGCVHSDDEAEHPHTQVERCLRELKLDTDVEEVVVVELKPIGFRPLVAKRGGLKEHSGAGWLEVLGWGAMVSEGRGEGGDETRRAGVVEGEGLADGGVGGEHVPSEEPCPTQPSQGGDRDQTHDPDGQADSGHRPLPRELPCLFPHQHPPFHSVYNTLHGGVCGGGERGGCNEVQRLL